MSAASCAIRRVRILRMCLELDSDLLLVMDELVTGGVSDSQKACWHIAGPENISSLLPTEGFPNPRPWPCQCKLHSAVRFLSWFVYPGAWQVYLLNDQQTEHQLWKQANRTGVRCNVHEAPRFGLPCYLGTPPLSFLYLKGCEG